MMVPNNSSDHDRRHDAAIAMPLMYSYSLILLAVLFCMTTIKTSDGLLLLSSNPPFPSVSRFSEKECLRNNNNVAASTTCSVGFSRKRRFPPPSSTIRSTTTARRQAIIDDDEINNNYDDSDEDLFLALFNEKKEDRDKEEEEQHTTTAELLSFSSAYDSNKGAGVPRSSLAPEEIVPLLMTALQNKDVPVVDGGLISMWEFASDTTKFIFKNNMTEFIESCHETANEWPTSFYGVAMKGKSWTVETQINRVGGEDGWIATQVMKTISRDGRLRRWQWELRKNKRPPCLGCWKIENIASSDRNGEFEPGD